MEYLPPLINGKAEEHADIAIVIMNQKMTGFTSIEYMDEQDIENVYAAGANVNARVHGKVKPTAKISFLSASMAAFQSVAPNGRIQQIPEFDVIVTYVDTAYITRVHILKNVRFKNNGRKAATGDGAIVVDCDIVISEIQFKS